MNKFRVQIKERGNDSVLTPVYEGDKSREEVADFFGCHESDVEWYRIEEIKSGTVSA